MASSQGQQPSEIDTESSYKANRPLGAVRSFSRLEIQDSEARPRATTQTIAEQPSLLNAFSDTNLIYEPLEESCHPYQNASDNYGDHHEYAMENAIYQSELPIEILGMTDSFIESLTAKIHPAPVSVDVLSSMFQEFYDATAIAISSYISKLREPRDSRSLEQPMVSMSEIVQRKKERKYQDVLCIVLQEAVERRVTEAVFDKIWRHHGAEDEARDEALRSKTMALAVVGVGLKELGFEEEINVMDLHPICEALQNLNSTRSPQSKLKLLKRAHKAIVDVLTTLVPSTTSSADHILPVLIYSLIISPPQIHIISNILYIQRFRYHKAIDGEAAYCLTNIEAAVSFLETVDMGTLTTHEIQPRATEGQEVEMANNSMLPLPNLEGRISAMTASPIVNVSSVTAPSRPGTDPRKNEASLTSANGPAKRINYLTPVEFAASAATSAVNTADQSLKTIGNSLENSYKFLFGKLSDKRTDLPQTLEDVRKLVGTPNQELGSPKIPVIDDTLYSSDLQKSGIPEPRVFATPADQLEGRERNSFENNVADTGAKNKTEHDTATSFLSNSSESASSGIGGGGGLGYTPVADSVRNIGNQLGRFAGNINVIRSFSRTQMAKTPSPSHSIAGVNPSSSAVTRLSQHLTKIEPPIPRFLEVEASDLRVGDVDLLLRDYRRLAAALKDTGMV